MLGDRVVDFFSYFFIYLFWAMMGQVIGRSKRKYTVA